MPHLAHRLPLLISSALLLHLRHLLDQSRCATTHVASRLTAIVTTAASGLSLHLAPRVRIAMIVATDSICRPCHLTRRHRMRRLATCVPICASTQAMVTAMTAGKAANSTPAVLGATASTADHVQTSHRRRRHQAFHPRTSVSIPAGTHPMANATTAGPVRNTTLASAAPTVKIVVRGPMQRATHAPTCAPMRVMASATTAGRAASSIPANLAAIAGTAVHGRPRATPLKCPQQTVK